MILVQINNIINNIIKIIILFKGGDTICQDVKTKVKVQNLKVVEEKDNIIFY